MLSRWTALRGNSAVWRIAAALLFSVLLHLFLLGFLHVDLSMFEPERDVVKVRFAQLARPPSPEPAEPEIPPVEKPEPEKIEEPPPAPEPPVIPVEELAGTESVLETLPQDQESDKAVVADSAEEVVAPEEALAPEEDLVPVASLMEAEVPPLSFVESEFEILRGIDGYKVGQTSIRYIARDDGTYLLESESEAKGFASFFISGNLIQRSEGLVTGRGLQPQNFLYQYGKSGKTQRAIFDWENHSLRLETDKGTKTARLPRDAQDLVSFMYQFMFVPPLQEMQLNITNGKRMKAYGYSFVGEEDLMTKMGVMRAMHIENINDDGDEKTELWLALEYNYLPVKIRKTEKDGSVIEQVVSNINTELLQ